MLLSGKVAVLAGGSGGIGNININLIGMVISRQAFVPNFMKKTEGANINYVGAGGGGFSIFCCENPDKRKFRRVIVKKELGELKSSFIIQ